MGHRDLADFYRSVGDYSTAMKHYTKSREFCTTSQHVLDMCLSVLEVRTDTLILRRNKALTNAQLLIEQRNYAHLPTYVFKADAALDAATAAAATSGNANNGGNASGAGGAGTSASSMVTSGKKKLSAERENVQSKLDFATALSHLGQANYEKAAYYFLRLGPVKDLGDWAGKVFCYCSSPFFSLLAVLVGGLILVCRIDCGPRGYRRLWHFVCALKPVEISS